MQQSLLARAVHVSRAGAVGGVQEMDQRCDGESPAGNRNEADLRPKRVSTPRPKWNRGEGNKIKKR